MGNPPPRAMGGATPASRPGDPESVLAGLKCLVSCALAALILLAILLERNNGDATKGGDTRSPPEIRER